MCLEFQACRRNSPTSQSLTKPNLWTYPEKECILLKVAISLFILSTFSREFSIVHSSEASWKEVFTEIQTSQRCVNHVKGAASRIGKTDHCNEDTDAWINAKNTYGIPSSQLFILLKPPPSKKDVKVNCFEGGESKVIYKLGTHSKRSLITGTDHEEKSRRNFTRM